MRMIDRQELETFLASCFFRGEHAVGFGVELSGAGGGVDEGIAAHDSADWSGGSNFNASRQQTAALVGEFRLCLIYYLVVKLARQDKAEWC